MKIARIVQADRKINWGLVDKSVKNGLPPINALEVDSDVLTFLTSGTEQHLRDCCAAYLNQIDETVARYQQARRFFTLSFMKLVRFLEQSGVHLTGGRAGIAIYTPKPFYYWGDNTPAEAFYSSLNNQASAKAVKQMLVDGTVIVVETTNSILGDPVCTVQVYTPALGFTLSFKDSVLDEWNFFCNLPTEVEKGGSAGGVCIYPSRVRVWVNTSTKNQLNGMHTFTSCDQTFVRPYHINGKFVLQNFSSHRGLHPTPPPTQMIWEQRAVHSY